MIAAGAVVGLLVVLLTFAVLCAVGDDGTEAEWARVLAQEDLARQNIYPDSSYAAERRAA